MSRARHGGAPGAPGAPGEPGTTHLGQGPVPPVLIVSLVGFELRLVLIGHQRDRDNTSREVQDVVEHGVADCHWERGGACSASLRRESLHSPLCMQDSSSLGTDTGNSGAEGWKSALWLPLHHGLGCSCPKS